jgi:uncharacterized protein (UPF0335 family)
VVPDVEDRSSARTLAAMRARVEGTAGSADLTIRLPYPVPPLARDTVIGEGSSGYFDEGFTMNGPGGVAGDQLRAFVERIEHVEEEIKALNEDKKSIFDEAKGEGYDVKILKEVIRLRKQDKKERDEHESLLEVYLHAIETAQPHLQAAE